MLLSMTGYGKAKGNYGSRTYTVEGTGRIGLRYERHSDRRNGTGRATRTGDGEVYGAANGNCLVGLRVDGERLKACDQLIARGEEALLGIIGGGT